MIILRYEQGHIRIIGSKIQIGDEEKDLYPAYLYPKIKSCLEVHGKNYRDEVPAKECGVELTSDIHLREYQREALQSWSAAGNRGIIILPTGSGKTVVAIKAIEELESSTLIVVPTLVLLDQWRESLEEQFGTKTGRLGGGIREIEPITVSTYDSASIRADELGDRFELIVFDEVHHLPAPSYRRIGERYIAPYRMGLTATLQDNASSRSLLDELVGEVVYHKDVDSLTGVHLANYQVRTVKLPLSKEERVEYNKRYGIYRSYLSKKGIKIRSKRDYLNFIRMSGRDAGARRALLSRNRAMDIALNSSTKIDYLKALLKDKKEHKTLIFTRHNKLVYRISKDLLIPSITHQTMREDREETLTMFRRGAYQRIVTSQVLDEGVDVPDASMAVILSGTGSNREFIQRLGRILRPKDGKTAILYELVSADTAEEYISQRRKGG
ncbi:MAG: DEAD/DEAH box helicase [Candidatus Bathyarchaeia archaeon]